MTPPTTFLSHLGRLLGLPIFLLALALPARAQGLEITADPQNATRQVGQAVTFTVGATGTPRYYRWFKDSSVVATTASYTFTPTSVQHSADVYAEVYNSTESLQSAYAHLTVLGPPVITVHPYADLMKGYTGTHTVNLGATATFWVGAVGSDNAPAGLSYQWRKNGVNIAGATAATYTIYPQKDGAIKAPNP